MGKKLVSIILTLVLVLTFSIPAFAAENDTTDIYSSDITISDEDMAFLNKVVSVAEYWYINENTNTLSIALTESELKNQFGFTDGEYSRLMSQIVGTYVAPDGATAPTPRFYIEDGTLFIEYTDLVGGVFAVLVVAAEAGPVAMTAAITAISTAIGGTAGTIIGLALGLSAADMCIRVLYAVATQQGIYIKPVLSYPLLEIDYF